jgi:thymidylate kinase
MIVICIEGSHASGKSTLCKQFEDSNYLVLDEAFFTMPEYALHPQSLVMETLWVAKWVERLLKKQSELSGTGKNAIFIADRSPYSAVFYAKGGHGRLLEPVIDAMIVELAQNDIHIVTVHIEVRATLAFLRFFFFFCCFSLRFFFFSVVFCFPRVVKIVNSTSNWNLFQIK